MKVQILLKLDQNLMNLFETGKKLARDSEKNISRQIFVKNVVVIERDDCEN